MAKIMVVDDEEALRESIQFALESKHEVACMEGGRPALHALRGGHAVDLILCDLMMPDMTGMELYKALSQELPQVAAKMLFMSGGAVTEESRIFLDSLPPSRIISKPFSLKEIRAAVETMTTSGVPQK